MLVKMMLVSMTLIRKMKQIEYTTMLKGGFIQGVTEIYH